jgi:hypothetical protein
MEKVSTSDLIPALITEVEYEKDHEFQFKGVIKKETGISFTFKLDGYEQPKKSGWMKFKYAEKATLYSKYVAPLVDGARPFFKFHPEQLIGMKVKLMFKDSDDGKWQNIETVRPFGAKIAFDPNFVPPEEIPF